MRIERIEIDGFGRFHDRHWPLPEGLTVLVGANEAGKTTLLNAVRALLFGFEVSRDGRAWYPAIAGGRRGGRLVLQTAAGERWTVERHGERGGGGALAVRAPNGSQGGQETLDRLLHGADRDLFNNIFAFGLTELQTIRSLSADGVRGRIYGAGAGLGGTSAIDLERRLRQQLDGDFLPRGSQRPLNAFLAEIEELRLKVADLGSQPAEHEEAHRERAAVVARTETLRTEIRERRERLAYHMRLVEARPIAAELALVEAEIADGDASLDAFPPDAVAVLDRRLAELAAVEARLAELDDQLDEARRALATVQVDERLLAHADEIAALAEERAVRTGSSGRQGELEASVTGASAAIEEQVARAGGIDEDRLVALDDSIASIEATRVHERELHQASAVAADAEQRRRTASDELERREREARPATDAGDGAERARAIADLDALRIRRAAADALVDRPAGASVAWSTPLAAAIWVASVAIGTVFGSVLDAIWPGVIAGAALGAVVVIAGRAVRPRTGGVGEIATLESDRRRLLAVLGLPAEATDADVRAVADEVAAQRVRRQLAAEQEASLAERRSELEHRTRDTAAASDAVRVAGDAWEAWLAGRALPPGSSPEAARQVLAAAGIARRAAADRARDREHLDRLLAEDAGFARRVDELLVALGRAPAADPARREAQLINLAAQLDAARAERRKCGELEAAIAQLAGRRAPLDATAEEQRREVARHLEALGCRDADAVRARDAAAAARREVRSRARELRSHLAGVAGSVDGIGPLMAEAAAADPDAMEAGRGELTNELERLETEERDALARIGALEARIGQLESTEDLGVRRQELAVVNGRAAAMARRWAVRAIALRLLEETRSRYERERQPDVIRAAEAHFERITAGRYTRIVAPAGDASLRVETEGGEGRVTDELSRGTAEQLYLALRFGLVEEFARHAEPLPVVMDDILVNFDADRATRAAAGIRDLSARHQVLYFTCHPWTAELLDADGRRTLALE